MANIHPGYLSRGMIKPNQSGSHTLLQGRDVSPGILKCSEYEFTRFAPKLSSRDILLQDDDILFMTRGVKNYSSMLRNVPENALASGSFFIIRVSSGEIVPGYLVWYLNLARTQRYFTRHSGQGVLMPVVRRTILEHLDVLLPSLSVQTKIAELFRLSLEEAELTEILLEKKAGLREAICLRAIRGEET